MSGFFITGTDTGCGKTEITLGLMAALQAGGQRVLGMKPVASGCDQHPEGLRNADAERIQAQGTFTVTYALVNPYAFAQPIAPHVAAEQAGVSIELDCIRAAHTELTQQADWVLVEGVGGWRVPLGPECFVGDIPRTLGLPVILVVGLKLGCLNHAILTAESIQSSGLELAGWIANQVDPDMLALEANLETLRRLIQAPCLGVVPWMAEPDPGAIAACLPLDR
ncbi:dethiobiotin synthase [Allochromatium palmeri]|uniref:ATP-dependent dethiobiotin synthetase BioD n=1 Tax=Allochromatium palmeri TaxID=231048 RepID=A0A6N8EG67_9GAMM|nr:dethiobiotin synthase [Allochromatium palmeri]MTW21537.1 dethiobiotin synthase [Allochromatium palmeri]